MSFRFVEDQQVLSFRFWYTVEDVEMPDQPMRVTHVLIAGAQSRINSIEVRGWRMLKSGADGTHCSLRIWDVAAAPAWLAEVVKDAGERATWG
jgi:hypothetical protein